MLVLLQVMAPIVMVVAKLHNIWSADDPILEKLSMAVSEELGLEFELGGRGVEEGGEGKGLQLTVM